MTTERSWRCPECGAVNPDARPDDGQRVGVCRSCYAYRPAGKPGRATVAADRLRAGDAILGGYVMDDKLRPVRRTVRS